MQNKVQIVPDELGNVIRVSQNNPEFGHVKLEQERITFGNTGWVNRKNVSTLLHGKVEDFREMGINKMTEISGKIVIRESLEPFNSNDPDRDLKIAGNTGIICCKDGQPIYRKTVFTADINAEDVLVSHDNGDAIREANQNENSSKIVTATPQQAFDVEVKETNSNDSNIEVESTTSENVEEEIEVDDSVFEL